MPYTRSVNVHSPLGEGASRPLKWRSRWPRSQEKAGGVNAYLEAAYPRGWHLETKHFSVHNRQPSMQQPCVQITRLFIEFILHNLREKTHPWIINTS